MPVLASSSRTQLRYILESVFGTTPVAGNPSNLRQTGESLDYGLQFESSKEIRSDRQTTDKILVGASAQGGFNFELSYAEFDKLIEATLQDTWVAYGTNGVSGNIPTSATFTASTLTAGAATSGNDAFTILKKGQWVKVSGSTISGQNKWAQVSLTTAPTTTVLTFEGTPFTGATGNGGAAVKVSSSRLANGTTQRSYTIEREHADITQFFAFRGMVPNKLSLSFKSGSIVDGSFDFMGKDSVRAAVTTLPGTPIASQSYDIMNAVSGVGDIYESGVLLSSSTFIQSATVEVNNNLRGQSAIGVLGNAGVASGTVAISGSLDFYLADGALYDKFVNSQNTSLSLRVQDTSGNGYVFWLPKLKLSEAKINAGAINQDVMVSAKFEAIADTANGDATMQKMLFLFRGGAAVT